MSDIVFVINYLLIGIRLLRNLAINDQFIVLQINVYVLNASVVSRK